MNLRGVVKAVHRRRRAAAGSSAGGSRVAVLDQCGRRRGTADFAPRCYRRRRDLAALPSPTAAR